MAKSAVDLESGIETFFCRQCKNHKLWPIKVWPFGVRGFPDRMILGSPRIIFFVELKRPGQKPRKLQTYMANRLRNLGFDVWTIDSKEKVTEFFSEKKYLRT
jgi:hypothetical protein